MHAHYAAATMMQPLDGSLQTDMRAPSAFVNTASPPGHKEDAFSSTPKDYLSTSLSSTLSWQSVTGSRLLQPPQELTGYHLATFRLPHHPSDHMTSSSPVYAHSAAVMRVTRLQPLAGSLQMDNSLVSPKL